MEHIPLLKCPLCGEDSVAFCQDIIVPYGLRYNSKGKIEVLDSIMERSNGLDETWFECISCNETSYDKEELRKLEDLL